MRPSSGMKSFVASCSYLVLCANAQGEPDARGKTPYDYVNPLIGTINGGKQNDAVTAGLMRTDFLQGMSFPAQHFRSVSWMYVRFPEHPLSKYQVWRKPEPTHTAAKIREASRQTCHRSMVFRICTTPVQVGQHRSATFPSSRKQAVQTTTSMRASTSSISVQRLASKEVLVRGLDTLTLP